MSSSAAVGSGGFGSDALSASSSASSARDLGLELLDPRADRLHLGDRLRGVGAGALGLADRLRAGVALGLRLLELRPQRVQPLARLERLHAAARRTRRGGAPARPASARDRGRSPSGRACATPRAGSRAALAPGAGLTSEPDISATNSRQRLGLRAGRRCSAASGRTRSRRCGSRTARSSRSPCAGRSSGRPCTRGSARWSRSPAVPATLSVWQPEQRSTNSTAALCCSWSRLERDSLLATGGDTRRGRGERSGDQQHTARPRHRVRQHRGPMPVRTLTSIALVTLRPRARRLRSVGRAVRERTGAFTVTLDDYLIRPQSSACPSGSGSRSRSRTTAGWATRSDPRPSGRNVLAITTISRASPRPRPRARRRALHDVLRAGQPRGAGYVRHPDGRLRRSSPRSISAP